MIVTTMAVTCSRGWSRPKCNTIEIPSSPPSTRFIGGIFPGLMLDMGIFKSASFTSGTGPEITLSCHIKTQNSKRRFSMVIHR